MPDAEADPATSIDADDLDLLVAAAREAGAIALSWFCRDPAVTLKAGGSPVSEADLAVDRRLAELLCAARPDYGWLSEETADGPERLSAARVFVVDPIDGTRAFLRGDPEWTVSLAVVADGRPVVAALFQPVGGILWTAIAGAGARRDGVPLAVTDRTGLAGSRLGAPRRWLDDRAVAAAGFAECRLVPSLALRIACVADGSLDVALGTDNAHDWDLAAADLLVQEAGGSFTTPRGGAIRYNAIDPRHPPLVAAVPGLLDDATRLLARLAGTLVGDTPVAVAADPRSLPSEQGTTS